MEKVLPKIGVGIWVSKVALEGLVRDAFLDSVYARRVCRDAAPHLMMTASEPLFETRVHQRRKHTMANRQSVSARYRSDRWWVCANDYAIYSQLL